MKRTKKYRVDFYDMFDGWINKDMEEIKDDFENIEDAKALRDKNNEKLPDSNKRCGEHYGVINLETNSEIDCPTEKWDNS